MSEPEFRIMIIRILAGVENRLESLSAEIKEVKNSQNEIKNAITELQSRMDDLRIREISDSLRRNNQNHRGPRRGRERNRGRRVM